MGWDRLGQGAVVLPGGKVQSLVRGGQGFGKPACFGIGGGERVENVRLLAATEWFARWAYSIASAPLRSDALGQVARSHARLLKIRVVG